MKKSQTMKLATLVVGGLVGAMLVSPLSAADKSEDVTKDVMKKYHKAPEGTEPVCKKALDGKASADELKKLIEGYKEMAKTKAPKGDQASWKEKTAKLLAAAQGLEKYSPEAAAKYKEAVNCKACHSAHKPD